MKKRDKDEEIKQKPDHSKLFTIDKHHLDEELVKHPKELHKYAELLADAEEEHSTKKARLEIVEAELSKDIRSDPVKYDLPKVTEDAIRNTVILQERYQTAKAKLIAAKHKVDVLEAVVEALRDTRSMLENLVKLFLSDYYAEPRLPKDFREEVETKSKNRVNDKIKRKLNRE